MENPEIVKEQPTSISLMNYILTDEEMQELCERNFRDDIFQVGDTIMFECTGRVIKKTTDWYWEVYLIYIKEEVMDISNEQILSKDHWNIPSVSNMEFIHEPENVNAIELELSAREAVEESLGYDVDTINQARREDEIDTIPDHLKPLKKETVEKFLKDYSIKYIDETIFKTQQMSIPILILDNENKIMKIVYDETTEKILDFLNKQKVKLIQERYPEFIIKSGFKTK